MDVLHTKVYITKTLPSNVHSVTWLTYMVVNLNLPDLIPLLRDEEACLDVLRAAYRNHHGKELRFKKKQSTDAFYQLPNALSPGVPAAVDANVEEQVEELVTSQQCKKQKVNNAQTEIQDEDLTSTQRNCENGADFDEEAKAAFRSRFLKLRDVDKFKLESGKFVEDVMYAKCSTFSYEHWVNASKNSACFALDLSESWILANPWQFLQNMFHDCRDIFILGGEKGGLASQERKDESREIAGQSEMVRRSMGKKGNGYVRILGSEARDVAAIEAGRKWEGAGATKAFVESQHILPKMLRDNL
ncbi:hypothetical protein HDU78_011240, partial [Chytriomyces hyalinus]